MAAASSTGFRRSRSCAASSISEDMTMRRPLRLGASLALAAGAVALAGCVPDELTEKPARGGKGTEFATLPSTIGAQASISLGDLAKLVSDKLPAQFNASGNGPDACIDLGLLGKHCAGTQYDFHAVRGAATISAVSPSTLRVAVPISFNGQGGLRGDGA